MDETWTSGWFRATRSIGLSALLVLFSLRESAPGAARQRVTFLLAQESNQRSAFKYKRTFDRAREPWAAPTPLEVRLEMRSVCAVPHVPPKLRGTGAPAVPPTSPTNTLRASTEQALLVFFWYLATT